MKARFKSIVLSALGAMAAFSAVTYSSCENDKCKAIVCAYGGVCTDGACLCPSGYEGPQCETITRARYLGPWVVTENGTITDAAQYTISLEPDENITGVKIKNFRNLFVSHVKGFVKGDTLYIPSQVVNNHTVMGKGVLEFDKFYGRYGKLTVRYTVEDQEGNIDDFGVNGGDASLWNK